jgi:hypothetical protein
VRSERGQDAIEAALVADLRTAEATFPDDPDLHPSPAGTPPAEKLDFLRVAAINTNVTTDTRSPLNQNWPGVGVAREKRRAYNRLGWLIQWGTVRMLGTAAGLREGEGLLVPRLLP